MILWDETQKRFGITPETARRSNRVVVACDTCAKVLDRIKQQHDQTVRRKGKYECHDCATKNSRFRQQCAARAKEKWKDAEYRRNNLESTSSDEYRQNQSKLSKRRWQDPEYRSVMEAQASQIASKRAKKAWSDPEYRAHLSDKISKRMTEQWEDENYRLSMSEKQSKIAKRLWQERGDELLEIFRSELFKSKMSAIGHNQSAESRNKISVASRALWANSDYRNKILAIARSDEMRAYQSSIRKGRLRPDLNAAALFEKRASEVHGDYDYSYGQYVGSKKPYTIKCQKHGFFDQSPNNHLRGTRCPKCAATFSKLHLEIANFVESIACGPIRLNDRTVIKPYELDIFLSNYPFAIEVDGLYWHSYGSKEEENRCRHSIKVDLCNAIDIPLLTIRENEWACKRPIIESMIRCRLGLAERIWARKCQITILHSAKYKQFMNDNHLQGYRAAKYKLGLVYNGELVMAIGFSKHQLYGYEITRMAAKTNMLIVGGVSRLISHFVKQMKPSQIMTYADRRYSSGNGYLSAGFELDGITPPGYCYVKNGAIYSRQQFQKHKLKKLLPKFDPDLSEAENMFINDYRRLWDAGHLRFLRSFNI